MPQSSWGVSGSPLPPLASQHKVMSVLPTISVLGHMDSKVSAEEVHISPVFLNSDYHPQKL